VDTIGLYGSVLSIVHHAWHAFLAKSP